MTTTTASIQRQRSRVAAAILHRTGGAASNYFFVYRNKNERLFYDVSLIRLSFIDVQESVDCAPIREQNASGECMQYVADGIGVDR